MSSPGSPARRVIPIAPVHSGSLYQSEAKVYPRAVSGWFAGWRWALVWATQLVFYGLPWLPWNGRPAVLFDLAARRFYLFDLVLYPQDFIYLAALLIVSAFALFLFTAVAGRLWCGYACPQTVYTELFLWIERRIEGDRIARMRLDAAPPSLAKWSRKLAKHAAWFALALATGFTFVGYFTPIRSLAAEALALSFGPWEGFWVLFYGFATYGNAGFMREQVCKYMCPYARFQGVMFDRDTLVIGYDTARGEPLGSRPKSLGHAQLAVAGNADFIDCSLCVQVCPTGIDIRKGLQYECIGCAACIDVCNDVMDKMKYPRGLIRYATQNGMANRWTSRQMWKRVARPRVLVYGTVLAAITIAFVASLALRAPFKADVVRDRGTLARLVEDGRIENVYRLQLMNATERTQRFHVEVEGLPGATLPAWRDVEIDPTEARWVPVAVQLPPEQARALGPGAHPMQFRIVLLKRSHDEDHHDGDASQEHAASAREKSTFVVPR
jgi:cytochrome c oxidase accessory protein FixG